MDRPNNDTGSSSSEKRLILIRHGRTHMNEYLATPGSQWGAPQFTDIFHDKADANYASTSNKQQESIRHLYQDSPLSNVGKVQAKNLHDLLKDGDGKDIVKDVELVAVSPLWRTMQTAEIGVLPHFLEESQVSNEDPVISTSVPFVALPLATERVYLISDIGKSVQKLNQRFQFADFNAEFDGFHGEEWWFTVKEDHTEEHEETLSAIHPFNYMHRQDYKEWRPIGDGQKYACLGEPDDAFHARMHALYKWIELRNESVICLVCHFGVLEWLVGEEFDNCEVRDVPFEKIKSHVLEKHASTIPTE